MNLQDLRLPSSLLADLYANCLIEPQAGTVVQKEIQKEETIQISFLGGNAMQIIICIAEEEQPYMNDEELAWLQRMLQACKLTLGDVAIVNLHSQKTSITQLKKQLRPKKVLMLGTTPADLQLPLNFPQFKLQEHDHCVYLSAPSARELNLESQEGKLLRTKLWVSLQKLFDV